MNSVQENKNELEAAVRYCESAISRAQATIESMEFRQQAATKAWHERTGREEALQREVADLKLKNEELKTNMALMTDQIEELEQAYKNEIHETMVWKKAHRELAEHEGKPASVEALQIALSEKDQTIALQRDQIAMFQRKMSRMNEVNR